MIENNLKSARILIVDDLESNIDVIRGLLEIEGYNNIESTTDSRKVLELVKSFEPELILLDLLMPYLSGFDVMELLKEEQLKSEAGVKYLPILVLTADTTFEAKQKALMAGAKDFLSKPFDLIELKLRIKNLLETQYLYQMVIGKNEELERKIVNFLKLNDEWYR